MIGLQPSRLQAELRAELERWATHSLWDSAGKPWRGADGFEGHYRNPADFLLQHGRQFESPTKSPPFTMISEPRCYANSVIAVQAIPRYRYVEGVSWAPPAMRRDTGAPVGAFRLLQHAWVIDPMDRVIDCTYACTPAGARLRAYFGVVFDDFDMVYRSAWDQERTALDNPADQWALLREPWTPGRRST